MRIDNDLCHKILIAIESDTDSGSGKIIAIRLDGYDGQAIAQHVKYLWETKMITGIDVTHYQSPCTPEIAVTDITPAGRAFLDDSEKEPRRKIGF